MIYNIIHVIIYYLRVNYSLQPAIVLKNKGKLETLLFNFYKENKFFGTILENSSNGRIESTDNPFIFGLPGSIILENSNNNTRQNSNTPFIFGLSTNRVSDINTTSNTIINTTTTNNIITEINNMPINNNFEQLVQIATRQYNNINNDNLNIRDNIFNIIDQYYDSSNNNNMDNNQTDTLRNEEQQLIINNQIRIREMLAGDDYEYSDIDTDYDGYTD